MPGITAGQLPVDTNGRSSSGGYAPGSGVLPIQLGTPTADAANGAGLQQSAPVVVQIAGSQGIAIADPTTPTQKQAIDATGAARVSLQAQGTAVTGSNTGLANASVNAALPAVSAKTNYITGFACTSQGGSGAAAALVTVTGTITGTLNYQVGAAANGVVLLKVSFSSPIPASAVNTAITVTMAALGANTGLTAVSVYGFVQ